MNEKIFAIGKLNGVYTDRMISIQEGLQEEIINGYSMEQFSCDVDKIKVIKEFVHQQSQFTASHL